MDERPTILQRSREGVGGLLRGLADRLSGRADAGRLISSGTGAVAANASGEYIDESNVLTVASAWAAVNAVASDVASMPLRLRKRTGPGASDVVTDHPTARLFWRSPDGGFTTPQQFIGSWVAHRMIGGNGYARAYWQGGWPVRLRVLNPREVVVHVDDETGEVAYTVKGKPVAASEILHLAGMGGDGVSGWSPTDHGRQTLGLSKAAESNAASFLGNAAIPCGLVKVPVAKNEQAAEAMLNRLQNQFSGTGRYRLHAVPQGTDWEQTSADPAAAQLLEVRGFQVAESSRLWRVPGDKLGDLTKASYATVEQNNLGYLGQTIRPICESIEAVLDLRLLTDAEVAAGYFWEFDFSSFLRSDLTSRANWIRNLAASGLLKVNEGRALADLPPLAQGGDEVLVPLNTGPLSVLESLIGAPAKDPSA